MSTDWYRLQQLLGTGSFSQVWKAKSRVDRREASLPNSTESYSYRVPKHLAVKTFRGANKDAIAMQRMIASEIDIHRRLLHPNIARFFETHETQRGVSIALEISEAGSLYSLVRKYRKLPESVLRICFAQLVSAVFYMHMHKIANRDVKLENALFFEVAQEDAPSAFESVKDIPIIPKHEGFATVLKVIDFGLAADLRDGKTPVVDDEHDPIHMRLTMTQDDEADKHTLPATPSAVSVLDGAMEPSSPRADKSRRRSVSEPPRGERWLSLVCGSLMYTAPEILLGKPYQGRPVDIWSAGVLLYACAVGSFPFTGKTEDDVKKRIVAGGPHIPSTVSEDLTDLILNMLNVDPERRFTIEEVIAHPWLSDPICQQFFEPAYVNCAETAVEAGASIAVAGGVAGHVVGRDDDSEVEAPVHSRGRSVSATTPRATSATPQRVSNHPAATPKSTQGSAPAPRLSNARPVVLKVPTPTQPQHRVRAGSLTERAAKSTGTGASPDQARASVTPSLPRPDSRLGNVAPASHTKPTNDTGSAESQRTRRISNTSVTRKAAAETSTHTPRPVALQTRATPTVTPNPTPTRGRAPLSVTRPATTTGGAVVATTPLSAMLRTSATPTSASSAAARTPQSGTQHSIRTPRGITGAAGFEPPPQAKVIRGGSPAMRTKPAGEQQAFTFPVLAQEETVAPSTSRADVASSLEDAIQRSTLTRDAIKHPPSPERVIDAAAPRVNTAAVAAQRLENKLVHTAARLGGADDTDTSHLFDAEEPTHSKQSGSSKIRVPARRVSNTSVASAATASRGMISRSGSRTPSVSGRATPQSIGRRPASAMSNAHASTPRSRTPGPVSARSGVIPSVRAAAATRSPSITGRPLFQTDRDLVNEPVHGTEGRPGMSPRKPPVPVQSRRPSSANMSAAAAASREPTDDRRVEGSPVHHHTPGRRIIPPSPQMLPVPALPHSAHSDAYLL